MYIDKLDNIVNKNKNTYCSTIKMNTADVKSSIHIHSSKKVNSKDPKTKFGDNFRNRQTMPWTYVINDLNGEEIVELFTKKKLRETN